MQRNRPAAFLLVSGFIAVVLTLVTVESDPGSAGPAEAAGPAATPVLSARRVPVLLARPAARAALARDLEPIFVELPETTCATVHLGGATLVSERGDVPLVPASTQKLLTASAALEILGPDTRLVTRAVAAASPAGGVLEGDLHLVGGGDPVLQTPGYAITFEDPEHPPPHTDLSRLADALRAAGITRITGGVVGDDSRYDAERYPASWPSRYIRQGQSGPLSALSVNDGFTGLSTDPDTPRSGQHAGDPPLLAAETLITLLEDRGVEVGGGPGVGPAPPGAAVLAELESPPVRDILAQMLTSSDNTTAELVLKEIGHAASGEGTTTAGAAAVEQVLAERGIDLDGLDVVDGSGLDPANSLTCDVLVGVLEADGPDGVIADGLAVSGRTGTMRRRLRSTPLEGVLVAKTGTLGGVSSLAGWSIDRNGDPTAFAIIVNGEAPTAAAAQDRLVLGLLEHPRQPATSELEPQR